MADISNISSKSTRKILGDAGEHYALSRFTFSGKPAMKMPEGWRGYDLGVETGAGLARVSVKTRSDSSAEESKWTTESMELNVCVFQEKSGSIRAWVIPMAVALEHANKPGPNRKNPHLRELSWAS